MNKKLLLIILWAILIVVALGLLALKKHTTDIAQNVISTCRIVDENTVKCDCDITASNSENMHITATTNANSCDNNMCVSLCGHYMSMVKPIYTNTSAYWRINSKSVCDVVDSKTIKCGCFIDFYIDESDTPTEHLATNIVLPADNCDNSICSNLCRKYTDILENK